MKTTLEDRYEIKACRRGEATEVFVTESHGVDFSPSLRAFILEIFHREGWNVTEEALLHNYDAWQRDHKSGYRDDRNGFFLFSPCGCNALRFEASPIREDDETYMA